MKLNPDKCHLITSSDDQFSVCVETYNIKAVNAKNRNFSVQILIPVMKLMFKLESKFQCSNPNFSNKREFESEFQFPYPYFSKEFTFSKYESELQFPKPNLCNKITVLISE